MIEISNVTFNYSAQGEQDAPPALREVNLSIKEGETVAIIGHNGSGKSTLAKLLAAILKPNTGSILVDGFHTDTGGEALWTIRQRVGIVFQNPDDQLVANTVIDDIAFGPENLGLPRFEIEERVQEAMTLLGLESYAQMAINELSVGQKQRVAIAGVLAMRPHYLLLDEPTTMISGQTARHLLETVQRLSRERGITVIHITHFMHEVTNFQRVIVMHEGRIVMDGTPVQVFARADELQAVGLDAPLVTHLGHHLRAQGWPNLPEVVLSTEQLHGSGQARTTTRVPTPPLATPAPTNRPANVPPPTENVVPAHPGDDAGAPSRVWGTMKAVSARGGVGETKTLFELRNVHHTYLRGTPFAMEALRGLSLTIPAGQTIGLVGPTKSGKSTIVDLLAGLIKPALGTLFFAGDDVAAPSFEIERIRNSYVLRGFRSFLGFLVFIFIIEILFNPVPPHTPLLWQWWILSISWKGIISSASIIVRVLFLYYLTSMLMFTTSLVDLTDGSEALLSPLQKIGIPVNAFIMVLVIAFKFVPIFVAEVERLMKAQAARGVRFDQGNVFQRTTKLASLFVPLFVSGFKRAEVLSIAMEARCYAGGRRGWRRSKRRELRFSRFDVIALVVTIAFCIVTGSVNIFAPF